VTATKKEDDMSGSEQKIEQVQEVSKVQKQMDIIPIPSDSGAIPSAKK